MKMTSIVFASALFLTAAGAAAQDAAPTDPQIADIAVTAHEIDINAGKLAESKAASKDVKAFAKKMVTDHTGANKAAHDLVKKLNVKPEDNPTSASLKSSADQNMQKLKGLKGADFDRAYIDNEVTYHQTVLDALDKTLIPNAKNDQLKALLTKTRPAVADHLEHAKQLQASMGKKS